MPFRSLLRLFFQSRYSEDVIQKLSETRGMRRAAQLTVYLFNRGKIAGQDAIESMKDSEAKERLESFQKNFTAEMKDGFRKLKDDIDKEQPKK